MPMKICANGSCKGNLPKAPIDTVSTLQITALLAMHQFWLAMQTRTMFTCTMLLVTHHMLFRDLVDMVQVH